MNDISGEKSPLAAVGEAPADRVARLDGMAKKVGTPCGEGELVWRVWGDGAPIVLLHGSFGSWTHWLRNIPVLSRHMQVIAVDLPGMGDSAEPPEPFSAESLARIISDGLDRVLPRPTPFHLAGFSFGGIIGGHVVLCQQERVLGYTALGSNGLGLRMAPRSGMARPNRSMTEDEIREVHRNNLGIVMFGDPGNIDELAVHLQMENTARARIRSGEIPKTDTLRQALARMHVPVTGIWGERDATAGEYLPDRERLFREIAPQSRFNVIPGAGHWACYEAADAVNRMLLSASVQDASAAN